MQQLCGRKYFHHVGLYVKFFHVAFVEVLFHCIRVIQDTSEHFWILSRNAQEKHRYLRSLFDHA